MAGYQALDLAAGPLAQGQAALLLPARSVGPVDGRPREVMLLSKITPGMLGYQQVLIPEQLLEPWPGRDVLLGLYPPDQPQGHPAYLVVHDQLLEAETALEVEHPGPGDVVDAGQGGQRGPHGRLQAGLGV